jgi:hypothetical protein
MKKSEFFEENLEINIHKLVSDIIFESKIKIMI